MATAAPRGSSLLQRIQFQWKRGWHEIPEVMGAMGYFVVGFVGNMYVTYRYHFHQENKTTQYKQIYTIMRPDDSATALVRRNELSPPMTSTPASLTNSKKTSC